MKIRTPNMTQKRIPPAAIPAITPPVMTTPDPSEALMIDEGSMEMVNLRLAEVGVMARFVMGSPVMAEPRGRSALKTVAKYSGINATLVEKLLSLLQSYLVYWFAIAQVAQ